MIPKYRSNAGRGACNAPAGGRKPPRRTIARRYYFLFPAAVVCLSLAVLGLTAPAQGQGLPRGLSPGLYYYFKSGDDRPSVYYVPNPSEAFGDPFSRPVRPMPVAALEGFPDLSFDSLRNYTINDLKSIRDQHRASQSSAAPGAASGPYADQGAPDMYVPRQSGPDLQLGRADLDLPRQAPQAGNSYATGSQPLAANPVTPAQQEGLLDELEKRQQWPPPQAFQQQNPAQLPPEQQWAPNGPGPTQAVAPGGRPQAPVSTSSGAYGFRPGAGAGAAYSGQEQTGRAAPLPPDSRPYGQRQPPAWSQPSWNAETGQRLPANVNSSQPPHISSVGPQAGPVVAMGAPPSPFRAMAPGAVDLIPRGRVNGVSLEQMEQATQWARQAIKYMHQNKNAEASALLEQAATMDPNPNSNCIHGNLAIAQKKLGNLDRALKEYAVALQFDPNDRQSLLGIAGAYQSKGNIPQALAWTHKFLESYPAAPEANDARKMLASLEKARQDMPSDDPGGPDYYESVTKVGPARWAHERFPLKVFIDQGNGARGYRRSFRKLLTDAFDQWASVSGNRIGWASVNDRNQADIICEWTSTTHKLQESTGAEGGQTATSIRRNPDGGWDIGNATINIVTLDMQGKAVDDSVMTTCCLHEVGHALGLKGHSNNNSDIMFFSESPTNSHVLTNRDINTIVRLYSSYPAVGQ